MQYLLTRSLLKYNDKSRPRRNTLTSTRRLTNRTWARKVRLGGSFSLPLFCCCFAQHAMRAQLSLTCFPRVQCSPISRASQNQQRYSGRLRGWMGKNPPFEPLPPAAIAFPRQRTQNTTKHLQEKCQAICLCCNSRSKELHGSPHGGRALLKAPRECQRPFPYRWRGFYKRQRRQTKQAAVNTTVQQKIVCRQTSKKYPTDKQINSKTHCCLHQALLYSSVLHAWKSTKPRAPGGGFRRIFSCAKRSKTVPRGYLGHFYSPTL